MENFNKSFIRHREAFNHLYACNFDEMKQSHKKLHALIDSFSSEQYYLLSSPCLQSNRKNIGSIEKKISRLSEEKALLSQFEESVFLAIDNMISLERKNLHDELVDDDFLNQYFYRDLKKMSHYGGFHLNIDLLLKKYLVCEPSKNDVFSRYLDSFGKSPETNKLLLPFIKYLIDISKTHSPFFKDLFFLIENTNEKVFHNTKNSRMIYFHFQKLIRTYLGSNIIKHIINDCKGIMQRRNTLIGKIDKYDAMINMMPG